MRVATLLPAFAALVTISAAASIQGLPSCAGTCVGTDFGGCGSLNVQCICSNSALISSLACCVSTACDQADQEATIQFADALCAGYSVSNLPTAATCASTSSGATSTTASGSSAIGSATSTDAAASSSLSSALSSASAAAATVTSSAASASSASQGSTTASSAAAGTSSAALSSSSAAAAAATTTTAASGGQGVRVEKGGVGFGVGAILAGALVVL